MRSTSRWLLLLALSFAICNAFAFTSSTKVMEWDEARRGVTAFEMLERGDFAVQRYRGEVDTFSVKPPLGLWAIAASYRVFGFNRFALRFPSGLAAVLTVVVVAWIAFRLFGGDAAAAAALVLATTPPFFVEHSARGGEYDAPLAFLIALLVAAVLFVRQRSLRASAVGGCSV
jgi:4-amino-4-deoxy-L-arabinose transferase-like glycosyltransferase